MPVFQPIQEPGLISPFITDVGTADSVTETGRYEIYTHQTKMERIAIRTGKAGSGLQKRKGGPCMTFCGSRMHLLEES